MLGVFFCLAVLLSSAASAPAKEPVKGPFLPGVRQTGKYSINSDWVYAASDVSAIARTTQTHGLIGVDEGTFAQLCEISQQGRAIRITDPKQSLVELMPPSAGAELDIEGIAAIGDTYYLTGSHGLAKKTAGYQPSRYHCFRFRANPQTGEKASAVEVSTLASILQKDPVLGPYYRKPLQQRGVNIEALAAKNGQLYFGFRSPNIAGNAYVLQIDPNELFGNKYEKHYQLHMVSLGPALGIREIAATEEGFLIIAGNAGSKPGDNEDPNARTDVQGWNPDQPFYLFSWDGDRYLQRIGKIPRASSKYKAEAMLVLEETDSCIDVLILFDGPPGGDPTVYQLRKVVDRN